MLKSLSPFWIGLLLAGSPAVAQSWQSGEDSRGAWSQVQTEGKTLRIACWPKRSEFFFTLSGGPFSGMKNADDVDDSMMMWIEFSDGRTARHPIDGHYYAPDKTFVGRFIVTDFVLEEFRNGAKLMLTSTTGDTLVEVGMKGTGKARGHFKEACGI